MSGHQVSPEFFIEKDGMRVNGRAYGVMMLAANLAHLNLIADGVMKAT